MVRKKREALTSAQQQLCVDYLSLAYSLARPFKTRWPHDAAEINSAALFALVEAAERFEPAREIKFGTYARHRLNGALLDMQRELTRRKKLYETDQRVQAFTYNTEETGRVLFCAPNLDHEQQVNSTIAIEEWAKFLPKKHAFVLKAFYLHDLSNNQIATLLKLSKSRVSSLHYEALEMLRPIIESRIAC